MSDDHQELVIIKRHHGDHDDHHGGAWKIAFADFMTAMMAFFLVMWLLAANDKTRATIARYFNPVKLIDATVRPPGIQDPKDTDTTVPSGHDTDASKGASKESGHKKSQGGPSMETAAGRNARLDVNLRDNPFAALAEIAGSQGAGEMVSKDTPRGSAPVIGQKGGAAFRDPFAPPPPPPPSADTPDKDDVMEITPPRPVAPPPAAADQAPPLAANQTADATKPPAIPDTSKHESKDKDKDLTKQLMASLKSPAGDTGGPDINVKRTNEGFLVSLTDTDNFSMFTSGSAVPSKKVVIMMERVAKILATKEGGVVVRGFTDNKPFRSGHYDNWNLSVDRAQAAHYMLVRGGLDDARIAGVQGFADRKTSPGLDPASPLNRRIEILLKDDDK